MTPAEFKAYRLHHLQWAYGRMRDAETMSELREAAEMIPSFRFPPDVCERLRSYYRHFAGLLNSPDAVECQVIEKISGATQTELTTIWNDIQPSLKLLDTDARARVWDEIERRQPPRERKWGRAA